MKKETPINWKELYYQLLEKLAAFEVEVKALRAENKELREKLSTNSGNSSKPPSQDPFREKPKPKTSGKKPGGQPGHQGHSRKTYSPEAVSKNIEVKPESCPHCATGHFDQTLSIEVKQVIELPELLPEVTQYNIHTCKCGQCGQRVRASVPKQAERGYGPRLMAFVTMLTAEGHVTKRKICALAGHLGIKISLGALCNIHKLSGKILEKPSQEIRNHVMEQQNVNADESGWRLRNKRCWIWIGATSNATVFQIDPSRSRAAFERFFDNFSACLTTDRYGAYNQYEGEKQICLAHIFRDFKKISERPGIDGSFGRILKKQLKFVFTLWGQFKEGDICRETLKHQAQEPIENMRLLLDFTTQKAKNSKTIACAYNLLDRFETLWTFLRKEGVEPTNNLAERGLRPAVIFRKISGGSQSEWGARMIERVMTIGCTLKQNGANIFEFLLRSFDAHLSGQPPPSPLPP